MTAEKSEPAASSCFETKLISFKYRWATGGLRPCNASRRLPLAIRLRGLLVAHESALWGIRTLDRRVFSLHVCNKAIFLAAQELPRKLGSRRAALHISIGAEPTNGGGGGHPTGISNSVEDEILWRS